MRVPRAPSPESRAASAPQLPGLWWGVISPLFYSIRRQLGILGGRGLVLVIKVMYN